MRNVKPILKSAQSANVSKTTKQEEKGGGGEEGVRGLQGATNSVLPRIVVSTFMFSNSSPLGFSAKSCSRNLSVEGMLWSDKCKQAPSQCYNVYGKLQ